MHPHSCLHPSLDQAVASKSSAVRRRGGTSLASLSAPQRTTCCAKGTHSWWQRRGTSGCPVLPRHAPVPVPSRQAARAARTAPLISVLLSVICSKPHQGWVALTCTLSAGWRACSALALPRRWSTLVWPEAPMRGTSSGDVAGRKASISSTCRCFDRVDVRCNDRYRRGVAGLGLVTGHWSAATDAANASRHVRFV